ncbi:hypothetical protein OSTOST_02595 [Ostertagia ostertagi]
MYGEPSDASYRRTNENKKVESSNATMTYRALYAHLLNTNDQCNFVETLSVEEAANGNGFQIAKFLAVLLNELRISNPDVVKDSVAVMEREGQDEPLREIFAAFDEEQTDWWSVMISRSDFDVADGGDNSYFVTPHRPSLPVEEFSGMSVNRSAFATPCGPNRLPDGRRRNNTGAYTVARCDSSPLMEAVNSPKVRELRCKRDLKALKKQLDEVEDQLVLSESRASNYKCQVESLVAELSEKKARIRELEGELKLVQRAREELEDKLKLIKDEKEVLLRQCESQKHRIAQYKSSSEKWEEKEAQLTEKLKAKEVAFASLERNLRDLNDELCGTAQTVHALETERDKLAATLEETKRAAEAEREQYQSSISEWRRRCETETSDKMALYSSEMEKNAALQRKLRELSEEYEKLQKQYDDSKRSFENTIEERDQTHKKNYNKISTRLAEVEAELAAREEQHKRFASEHKATVQQLESAHLADTSQRDLAIRSCRTRIDELESSLTECNRLILQQRKELTAIAAERDAVANERSALRTSLDEKDSQLCECGIDIDKLNAQVKTMESQHINDTRFVENLQGDCARLQAIIDAKDDEIFGMQMQLQNLMALSDVHSKVAQELEETQKHLADERKRNIEQASLIKTTAEDLMHKLEGLATRNCEQAEKINQVEHDMELKLDEARENEERYRAECEALREKDGLRTKQIQNLCMKFEKLDEDMCLYNLRNSELEMQVAQLKEENAQFYKCIELSSIKADKELIKMRFPNASASKGTLRRAVERLPSPADEMEGTPHPNPACKNHPVPSPPSKADLAKHRSNLKIKFERLAERTSFWLFPGKQSDERRDFKLDTDHSRLSGTSETELDASPGYALRLRVGSRSIQCRTRE